MPLLDIDGLHVSYGTGPRAVCAVRGVSLSIEPGESVGLVGESGCGKSTLAGAVLRLTPTQLGRIRFEGRDVLQFGRAELFAYRRRVQMIFQDPYGSLNPRLSVGAAIEEVLHVHRIGARRERPGRVAGLLRTVGLEPDHATRYPHEFSGGQRQRIGIARALALDPVLLVADEPVSALDVSVQAQVMNLLMDLKTARGLAYLFIAHDLAVVRALCDRVLVMLAGRIVESAGVDDLFSRPAHPYTRLLLSVAPDIERGLRSRAAGGAAAEPIAAGAAPADGCPFYPRCPCAQPACREALPPERRVAPGHMSRCHADIP